MTTEELLEEIKEEIRKKAKEKSEKYRMYKNDFHVGEQSGLLEAISIILEHQRKEIQQ